MSDVVLRDATRDDIAALAALHVRAFRETHGAGPNVALREHQWRSKLESGTLVFCLLLESDGQLIGFAAGELHRDEPREYGGELNKIYVLRACHRRGFGRILLLGAAERFLANGVTSMLLFGDASSPSNGFYEAMGAHRLYSAEGEFHGGYGWSDLRALAATV
jgi:ribosomal protein S18 acetylase RimI-like enzyme